MASGAQLPSLPAGRRRAGWLLARTRRPGGRGAGRLAWFVVDLRGARVRAGCAGALRGCADDARAGGARRRRACAAPAPAREQQVLDAERRLQEFLAAIQASPNGVVLLDRDGRIEWCNQTAAEHFGFDPRATCSS
jgi:two-component system phosphate regulon sensor histidine kinase PhoR